MWIKMKTPASTSTQKQTFINITIDININVNQNDKYQYNCEHETWILLTAVVTMKAEKHADTQEKNMNIKICIYTSKCSTNLALFE